MKFSLEGRRALVTGASRGIGEAIATLFAEHGADVAVSARSVADLEAVAERIRGHGRRGIVVPADITDVAEVTGAVHEAVGELGGLDILVNNAGGAGAYIEGGSGGLLETPLEAWDQLVKLNVTSALVATQAVVPAMIEAGRGSVINITSRAAFAPAASIGAYAATKAALQAFTLAWSIELGKHQVRVNAIAPGGIVTENFARLIATPESRAEIEATVPMGWLGEPVDAAACALFLASDEARWVNGATLLLSGGRM